MAAGNKIILTLIVLIGIPVGVTFLYSRFISPLRKYDHFKDVPKSYKTLVVACSILPMVVVLFTSPLIGWNNFYMPNTPLPIETGAWVTSIGLFILFSLNVIAVEAALFIGRHKPIAYLLFIPLMISLLIVFTYFILASAFIFNTML